MTIFLPSVKLDFMITGKFLHQLLLVLIVILALFLRVYELDEFPPGFYADEASIGFNAYKIVTTLHDEHDEFLPLFFEAFGEYKNAFAIYPVAATYWIMGVSESTTRLPQALIGVAVVLSMYFLAKELFNQKVGLISAFVIATAPWHVHLSRFTIESHNTFLLSIVLGTTFLLVSFRKNWEMRFLIFASITFAVAFYTYFATRIFTPLYLLGLSLIFGGRLLKMFKTRRRTMSVAMLIFAFITLPFVFHMLSGKGLARYKQVAFNKDDVKSGILIQRASKLYLDHFSPNFIFLKGDSDFDGQLSNRHSVNGLGLFYKWQLPFWVLGVLFLLLDRNHNFIHKKWIILLMLLLFPLGSVLSDAKTPYATRSIIGVVPYTLAISYGLYIALNSLTKLKNRFPRPKGRASLFFTRFGSHSWYEYRGFLVQNKIVKAMSWAFVVILVAFIASFFLNRFLNLYQAYINRASGYNGFQYGSKQIVNYFLENNEKYQIKIIYSGFDGTDALLNFYGLENCKNCYKFDPEPCNRNISKLIAVSVDDKSDFNKKYDLNLKKEVYYPDGSKAFEIFEAFSNCS